MGISTAEEFKVEEKDTKNLSTILEEFGRMILDIGDKDASGMPLLAFYLSRLSAFINAKRAVNLRVEVMCRLTVFLIVIVISLCSLYDDHGKLMQCGNEPTIASCADS